MPQWTTVADGSASKNRCGTGDAPEIPTHPQELRLLWNGIHGDQSQFPVLLAGMYASKAHKDRTQARTRSPLHHEERARSADEGVEYVNAPKHIRVWQFEDAPEELRSLSRHGGDEDWLALVPPALSDAWIPWLESGRGFGVCDVSRHEHPELPGFVVFIGAHA